MVLSQIPKRRIVDRVVSVCNQITETDYLPVFGDSLIKVRFVDAFQADKCFTDNFEFSFER
jgi:hypothetical protein